MAFSSALANSRSGTKEIVEYVEGKLNCLELFNQVSSGVVDVPCVSQHVFYINTSTVNSSDNYQPSATVQNHPFGMPLPLMSYASAKPAPTPMDKANVLKCTATVEVNYRTPGSNYNPSAYGRVPGDLDANITFSIPEKSKYPQWKVIVVVDKLQILGRNQDNLVYDCHANQRNNAEDLMQRDLKYPFIDQSGPYANYSHGIYYYAHKSEKVYFRLKCTITIPPNPQINSTFVVYGSPGIPQNSPRTFAAHGSPGIPKHSPPTFAAYGSRALNDFEALLNDSSTADLEIKVLREPEKSFHCHKAILAARSPGFKGTIRNFLKGTEGSVLDVKDISSQAMSHLLSFLYCGRFQDDSWINSLPELVYASKKYKVESLKELCDSHLIKCVTTANAIELGKLAFKHKLTNADADIRDFIAENIAGISFDG